MVAQQPSILMRQTSHIRPEQPDEALAICEVIRRAYADVSYSDHREHLMVGRLRTSAAYVPALSLVAEAGFAGHIMLTKIDVVDGENRRGGLSLAPRSVPPDYQAKGVGTQLVHELHRRSRLLRFPFIILVGLPDYFARFGYEPLDQYPVRLPFKAPSENCMALPLWPQALEGVRGNRRVPVRLAGPLILAAPRGPQ